MPANDNFNDDADNDLESEENEENKVLAREQTSGRPLGKGQKYAVAGLGALAILVVVVWAIQLKQSISQSFTYQSPGSGAESGATCQGSECGQLSAEELKARDTDKDGLSDWDELNVYGTSPYLEDSDSDGFIDKQEVDNETDPNCPVGRDCYSSALTNPAGTGDNESTGTEQSSSLNDILNQSGNQGSSGVADGSEQTVNDLLGGDLDAAGLRQLLLEHGMDKAVLDQISDEELLQSFSEVMNE